VADSADVTNDLDALLLGADGRIERVGARLAERLGYAPGELADQPLKLILGRWCPEIPTEEALRATFETATPRPFLNLTGAEVPLRVRVESRGPGGGVRLWADPPPPKPSAVPSGPAPSTSSVPAPPVPEAPPMSPAPPPVPAPGPGAPRPGRGGSFADGFLENLSHDFRTPLNGLLGAAALLADSPLAPQQREWLGILRHSAQALNDTVEILLDHARWQAGDLALRESDFWLKDLLADLTASVKASAGEKAARWTVEAPSEAIPCRGDAERLRQILRLLALRVLRTAPPEGRSLRVARVDRPGELAVLRFDFPAPEVPGAPAESHGAGPDKMGLALAQNLLRQMGGTLTVLPADAGAEAFRVEIPCVAPATAPVEEAPSKSRGSSKAPRPPRAHYRILVAEDNPVNQKVLQLQLEKLGYRADVAADGRAAVELFKKKPYDLVLMDCQMPGGDGYQATEEIRRWEDKKRRTPVVAVTANATEEDRERCRAAGMDEYLTKPLATDALAATLSRWDVSVDPETLQGLRNLGEEGFPALREDFLRQTHEQIAALRHAVVGADWKEAMAAAHKIKGTSGTFGALRLQRLSRWVEDAAERKDAAEAPLLTDSMEEEWGVVAWCLGAGR